MAAIIKTKFYCDFCGNKIPKRRVVDNFGRTHKIPKTGKVNCEPLYINYNMEKIGIYLCELCAEKISHQLDLLKHR